MGILSSIKYSVQITFTFTLYNVARGRFKITCVPHTSADSAGLARPWVRTHVHKVLCDLEQLMVPQASNLRNGSYAGAQR